METLLEYFLFGIDKFVNIVKYTLEAFFFSCVAEVYGLSVLVLLLGEEVSTSLLQIQFSFLFEADFLPEISRFVYADKVWECDVARLFIKVLC